MSRRPLDDYGDSDEIQSARAMIVLGREVRELRARCARLETAIEAGRRLEGLPHDCPDADAARAESSHDGSGAPEYPPEWDLRCEVCTFFRALTALDTDGGGV